MSNASDSTTRQTEIIVPFVEYEWWLMRWADNGYECRILVDHEGLPYPDDILIYCGETLYEKWLKTKPCNQVLEGGETSSCSGLYLHKVASERKEKTISVDLPEPEAWISISGCDMISADNHCEQLPNLLITGIEPLPNETISRIQVTYNEIPFMCSGDTCEVPMRPTLDEGVEVKFWVDSSYGDSSEQYTARVRVVDAGVSTGPSEGGWFVDVMSGRWRGDQAKGCGPIWDSFPPISGLPSWLASPDQAQLLATDEPYMYLAGKIIAKGIVDARDCPSGGLELNGYANMCGLEKARSEVDAWQNRFDTQIVLVSEDTGIPSQLMKNMFASESQFWPGALINANEYGLGHLTELGTDALLLWNNTFFSQFCPLVLDESACDLGYPQLEPEDQEILRGALAVSANSDCLNCPADIDLNHATFNIELFAHMIMANCQQVGQIVTNVTGKSPGSVVKYEDLWRFTVANYRAGPGCLTKALNKSASNPSWNNISSDLEADCPGTIRYVERITK